MKCKNCQSDATKALMWAEHRAYIPSCDKCEETIIKKNPQCDIEKVRPIEYILEKKRKRMEKKAFLAFSDELQKIASATVGAGIGAGLSALRGGMKEWDRRLDEDRYNLSPEQKAELRKRRTKRLGAGVGVGAGGGAIAGHYAGKAMKGISNEMKGVSEHAAQTLSKGFSGGIREGSKGLAWNIFRRAAKK